MAVSSQIAAPTPPIAIATIEDASDFVVPITTLEIIRSRAPMIVTYRRPVRGDQLITLNNLKAIRNELTQKISQIPYERTCSCNNQSVCRQEPITDVRVDGVRNESQTTRNEVQDDLGTCTMQEA